MCLGSQPFHLLCELLEFLPINYFSALSDLESVSVTGKPGPGWVQRELVMIPRSKAWETRRVSCRCMFWRKDGILFQQVKFKSA